MKHKSKKLLILAFLSILTLVGSISGEHLPVRHYTSADGLGSSFINSIMRDSRGFMWVCTRDGLSRFDGSRFVTYKVAAVESPPGIEVIYETRNGDYWISTTGGLFRFKPNALSPASQASPTLNAEFVTREQGYLLEDRYGNFWFTGGRSLYLIKESDGKVELEKIELNLPPHPNRVFGITDIVEASDGSLWLNTNWGLVRRLPDGRIIFYDGETQNSEGNISMIIDSSGKIWLARALELFIINPEPLDTLTDSKPLTTRPLRATYTLPAKTETEIRMPENTGEILYLTGGDFLSKLYAKSLFETTDRHVWLSADRQLIEFDGRVFRRYEVSQGFSAGMSSMAEDAAGNLWIGGRDGLMRLDRKGFISYGTADGFKSDAVHAINEAPDGTLYFADSDFHLNKFDGEKFESIRPAIAPKLSFLWVSRYAFLDSRSEWWILTNQMLYRFAARDLHKPLASYTNDDGLKASVMFQIFEDSHGTIWVSTRPNNDEGRSLARFVREENRFQAVSEAEGFPPNKSVSSYAEDAQGNLWFGFYEGGAARYSNGRFQVFSDELPGGLIADLHIDRSGRLWLATANAGLLRLDDTAAENPQFIRFTTDNGLSSNNVRTITEDRFGRIYLGTVRGVDRLSPETNRIKHFSIQDGLASDFVTDSHCDRNGVLWFATMGGLSRLVPLPDEMPSAPTIWLGGLRIAGIEQPVSQLGEAKIEKGEMMHTQNNLQIDFFGMDFRAGETLRYQYRLEGAQVEDWSAPTELGTVTFGNLQPGTYRFLVRAVNSEGVASENPAIVSFKILPPVLARWWFILICILLTIFIIVLLHRYRTARLREVNAALRERHRAEEELLRAHEERVAELEKVRSRIATDLHDDIGSSLTQIAVLSAVAQTKAKAGNGAVAEPLTKISAVSNELVETMSDIVWSINPAKDHLHDLTQRMRRFASDVLTAKGIAFQFVAPAFDSDISVNTNLRREVFLIFKEAVSNIVKHSGASNAKIEFEISGDALELKISDNGTGFQIETNSSSGSGVLSMKKRAAEMSGSFEITSEKGKGTTVSVSLPLEAVAAQTGGDGKEERL